MFRKALGWMVLLGAIAPCIAAEPELPVGTAPAPVAMGHFPNRVYAFVWRNWQVVEPQKMAEILGTSVENVIALAESMGLPPAAAIPPRDEDPRLHHPHPPQLASAALRPIAGARGDDAGATGVHAARGRFLVDQAGQPETQVRAAPLQPARRGGAAPCRGDRRVVEEDFGEEIRRAGRTAFRLRPPPQRAARAALPRQGCRQARRLPLRFIYSYFAVYGDPLLESGAWIPIPTACWSGSPAWASTASGCTSCCATWRRAERTFPEFGADHEQRLANLRPLVAAGEAVRHRRVSLHERAAGDAASPSSTIGRRWPAFAKATITALCTSHPAVRQWMGDALTHVFREVPDLAGVYTITASENLTNCASHGRWKHCPRCKDRSDADIIAEVNAAIEAGVHRGNPKANVHRLGLGLARPRRRAGHHRRAAEVGRG